MLHNPSVCFLASLFSPSSVCACLKFVNSSCLHPFDHTSHLYDHPLMYPTMQVVATVIYPHDEPPAPLPRAVEAMLAQHFSSVTAAKKAIRRREILVAGKVCNTSRHALQLPYVLAVMVSS